MSHELYVALIGSHPTSMDILNVCLTDIGKVSFPREHFPQVGDGEI